HRNLMGSRTGLENQGVYDLNVAPQELMKNSGGAGHWGLYSYVARLNYEYQGKYLIELIGRADGSSRFAEGFKWANYGGASLGWVLTEEAFLRNNPIVSFWKLKASYGEMGNQVGIGENDYVSTIGTGSIPFGSTPALQNTARVSGLTTNVRTWERVKMTNFGTEFTLLRHKLTGSFDYYIKRNEDMLASVVYPALLGGNAPKTNNADLETKGWEAVLGYKDKVGNLRYGVSMNMGNSTNELIRLEGADSYTAGKVGQREGYPLNSYFMYQTNGLFADQAAVDAYYATYTATQQGEVPVQGNAAQELRPGDIIKVDADGNGYISAISDEGGDVRYMGDAAPHFNYGINANLGWKGFDFTASFQGVLNQNIQRTGHMSYPFRAIWSTSTTSYMGKTWSETNTSADYPRLTTNGTRSGYNWLNNDFALQNNRYLRLKTLVIGYTLPDFVLEKIRLKKARLYLSGNDLWEATSIKDGYDPEMGETGSNIYPFTRTYSLGLDISF
ncbi:MAG: SusC/RagA family TonB-linked outer membrane protein, partial [Marinoscillum sp.]